MRFFGLCGEGPDRRRGSRAQSGPLAGSFIPPADIKTAQDVIRCRTKVSRQRATESARLDAYRSAGRLQTGRLQIGVAAFGAIFARRLTSSLATAAGTGVPISASGGQLNPATVGELPAQAEHDAIAHAGIGVCS